MESASPRRLGACVRRSSDLTRTPLTEGFKKNTLCQAK